MTQYLLSVHGGENDAFESDDAMAAIFAAVDVFNDKLQEEGKWVFAGGLHPASTATVVNAANGKTMTTDGPYLESKEHIGGFWVIEAADLDEALRLAAEASTACAGAVEVRPFQDQPDDA